jgi:adenylosuccinate synthase
MLQGATEAALTNLDVLGYLPEIPVCVGYELADGTVTDRFPATAKLETARPILQQLPGWLCGISHIRSFDELPEATRNYVEFAENAIGVRIANVSVGPRREQLIER